MNSERIAYLLRQYLDKKVTEPELYELTEYLLEEDTSEELQGVVDQLIAETPEQLDYKEEPWEPLFQKILHAQKNQEQPLPKEIKIRRMPWRTWAAAAVIILALGTGSYFVFFEKEPQQLSGTTSPGPANVNDIPPGEDKAILSLADGRQIVLDSSRGKVAMEGGVTAINLGGQLSYEEENALDPALVAYHTVSTPRGGQYQLMLQDGTHVWLNAASSLRFPTAFTGKDRVVELTGEGYFEVAPNSQKPFRVSVNGIEVQVLGTHFNINSYSDEPSVNMTLLEGRVMVKRKDKHVYLDPGQQAILRPGQDNIRVVHDVDIEEVIAWKNGRFLFNSANIETIMRQVARWYDVEIIYSGNPGGMISGGLPRSENVSQLLKILEAAGKVDFEIKGRQVIVKPK